MPTCRENNVRVHSRASARSVDGRSSFGQKSASRRWLLDGVNAVGGGGRCAAGVKTLPYVLPDERVRQRVVPKGSAGPSCYVGLDGTTVTTGLYAISSVDVATTIFIESLWPQGGPEELLRK